MLALICSAAPRAQTTGELRVVKSLQSAGGAGLFNLQIDGTTAAANVGDSGNTGLMTLSTGTHTVGETAGTATTLANYASAIVCKANDGAGATVASGQGAGRFDVPVGAGDRIACTITNIRTWPVSFDRAFGVNVDPSDGNTGDFETCTSASTCQGGDSTILPVP